jgi:hypothetical protein
MENKFLTTIDYREYTEYLKAFGIKSGQIYFPSGTNTPGRRKY